MQVWTREIGAWLTLCGKLPKALETFLRKRLTYVYFQHFNSEPVFRMFPSVEFSPLIYPLIHRFEFVASAVDEFLDSRGFHERETLAETIRSVQEWQSLHCGRLSQTEQLCVVNCRNIITAYYGLDYFLEYPELDPDPDATQAQYEQVVIEIRDLFRRLARELRECYLLSIGESSLAIA